MPQAVKNPRLNPASPVMAGMSPVETARYTAELLDSMRKIAVRQGQGVLAHLLELARYEAQTLAIKTMTPDSPDAGRTGQPARVPAEQ
jgi:hypothetical protein